MKRRPLDGTNRTLLDAWRGFRETTGSTRNDDRIDDPAIIEIVGNSGFDFVILDNEHSPIEPELAGHLIRAAETSCVLPLVRVIQNDPYLISKMVDAGARGVVVPHINTADDVRKAVAALRFAPDGPRGWCPSAHTAKYSVAYWSRHSEGVSAGTSIIPLIESREAVKNIDEILAVPGVEIVLFGPGDLSHEMGVHLEGLRSAELQQAVGKGYLGRQESEHESDRLSLSRNDQGLGAIEPGHGVQRHMLWFGPAPFHRPLPRHCRQFRSSAALVSAPQGITTSRPKKSRLSKTRCASAISFRAKRWWMIGDRRPQPRDRGPRSRWPGLTARIRKGCCACGTVQ